MVAVFSVSGNAQFKPVRFGLKVGPSIDWASSGSTAAHNEGVRLGGNVGVVCEQYFTPNFAFVSGLSLNYLNICILRTAAEILLSVFFQFHTDP